MSVSFVLLALLSSLLFGAESQSALDQQQSSLRATRHHHHHHHHHQIAADPQPEHKAQGLPIVMKVGCDRPTIATDIGYVVVPNPPVPGEKVRFTGHGTLTKPVTGGNWTASISLAGGVSPFRRMHR